MSRKFHQNAPRWLGADLQIAQRQSGGSFSPLRTSWEAILCSYESWDRALQHPNSNKTQHTATSRQFSIFLSRGYDMCAHRRTVLLIHIQKYADTLGPKLMLTYPHGVTSILQSKIALPRPTALRIASATVALVRLHIFSWFFIFQDSEIHANFRSDALTWRFKTLKSRQKSKIANQKKRVLPHAKCLLDVADWKLGSRMDAPIFVLDSTCENHPNWRWF